MALAIDPRYVIELQPARLRPSPSTYRRRRVVAAVLALALVVAVLLVAVPGLTAAAGAVWPGRGSDPATVPAAGPVAPAAAPSATYVVQPGDSLWSIAERMAPSGDVAGFVDDLVDANGGATIWVGQLLVLPG